MCTPIKATKLNYDLLLQMEEIKNASLSEISTACSEESNDHFRNIIEKNQMEIETENSQTNNYADIPFFDFKIKKSESLSLSQSTCIQHIFYFNI